MQYDQRDCSTIKDNIHCVIYKGVSKQVEGHVPEQPDNDEPMKKAYAYLKIPP